MGSGNKLPLSRRLIPANGGQGWVTLRRRAVYMPMNFCRHAKLVEIDRIS
jgi:hypothetical protein